MKKRKERTNINRINKKLEHYGNECNYWDGGCAECMLPWSRKGEKGCNGNPFICKKLYYKYLASTKKSRKRGRLRLIESMERMTK